MPLGQKKTKHKQKQYCNKFNEDLKKNHTDSLDVSSLSKEEQGLSSEAE